MPTGGGGSTGCICGCGTERATRTWRGCGRGIIVTDACRWDLAQDLAKLLEGDECSLAPVLTTLPSNTPCGMAALLPLAEQTVVVEFGAGKPAIRQGDAKDLDTRDGRKAFLRAT